MTAKEFMQQYQTINTRISAKQEEIMRLRSRITSGTSRLSNMPKGTPQAQSMENTIIRIIELEGIVCGEYECLIDIRQDISRAISKLSDQRYRTLLEMRYINGYKWHRISYTMHYERSHIMRMHEMALCELEQYIKITKG